ncbi:helix-turn-helix domain-containing protein [Pseudoclavibacter endophyticus]|uniref:helix-turn-helix domain-containing protein n=1 Tax=Pseudoclavibacter endophyticus TaxID=1778590 RepID=UPI00166B03B5|nr:helix-turn-helix transcriptional regulator [Pseudoclavibacter endophyticus]
MSETPTLRLGANIARYRKLAGISAQALADAAKNGLSRSQIADLENGRKKDLSVLQLLAVARVLGVPPVALLADLFDPGADAGPHPMTRTVSNYNFSTASLESRVEEEFDQNRLRLWVSGSLEPSPQPIKDPAPKAAYGALRDIDLYMRIYMEWKMAGDHLHRHRRDGRQVDAAVFEKEMGQSPEDYESHLVERLRQATQGLKFAISRLSEDGVHLPTALSRIRERLQALGVADEIPINEVEINGDD